MRLSFRLFLRYSPSHTRKSFALFYDRLIEGVSLKSLAHRIDHPLTYRFVQGKALDSPLLCTRVYSYRIAVKK